VTSESFSEPFQYARGNIGKPPLNTYMTKELQRELQVFVPAALPCGA
jgi:hypothetical protein